MPSNPVLAVLCALLFTFGVPGANNAVGAPITGDTHRTDAQGDPLPSGAVARLGSMRLRNGSGVQAVAFSEDGKLLASVGGDRVVRVWNVATGREVKSFRGGHVGEMTCVAFSADGKTLAAGSYAGKDNSGDVLSLWDFHTGRCLQAWKRSDSQCQTNAVAFSPDGKSFATSVQQKSEAEQGMIDVNQIRNTRSGELLAQYRPFKHGDARRLAFSPDGKILAAINFSIPQNDDGLIHLWDVLDAKELPPLRGHRGTVVSIAFSPEGKTLASAGRDMTYRLWDLTTGKEIARDVSESEDYYRFVGFAAGGKALLRVDGSALHVWDLATKKETRVLKGDWGLLPPLPVLSPDGTILAMPGAGADPVPDYSTPPRASAFFPR